MYRITSWFYEDTIGMIGEIVGRVIKIQNQNRALVNSIEGLN